jgi:hypothetical protein
MLTSSMEADVLGIPIEGCRIRLAGLTKKGPTREKEKGERAEKLDGKVHIVTSHIFWFLQRKSCVSDAKDHA